MHRVTPVKGNLSHLVAVPTFATKPGFCNSPQVQTFLWGWAVQPNKAKKNTIKSFLFSSLQYATENYIVSLHLRLTMCCYVYLTCLHLWLFGLRNATRIFRLQLHHSGRGKSQNPRRFSGDFDLEIRIYLFTKSSQGRCHLPVIPKHAHRCDASEHELQTSERGPARC